MHRCLPAVFNFINYFKRLCLFWQRAEYYTYAVETPCRCFYLYFLLPVIIFFYYGNYSKLLRAGLKQETKPTHPAMPINYLLELLQNKLNLLTSALPYTKLYSQLSFCVCISVFILCIQRCSASLLFAVAVAKLTIIINLPTKLAL